MQRGAGKLGPGPLITSTSASSKPNRVMRLYNKKTPDNAGALELLGSLNRINTCLRPRHSS